MNYPSIEDPTFRPGEPYDGMHGTCTKCGGQIFYQDCPTGGWWIHEVHPADNHDAEFGGPA